jgi:hypothetical protein
MSYPEAYGLAEYQRSIVFSGFSMAVNDRVAFTVSMSSLAPTGDTLAFYIDADLNVVYISFHVLLANATSSFVWIEMSSTFYDI